MRTVFALCLAFCLGACAPLPHPAKAPASAVSAAAPTPVLLISIDGLRPRDVTDARMPRLARLGREGLRTEMRPSYPSLTFPNHYTLVTGLRPDHHGIVHNQMQDPSLGTFTVKDRGAVGHADWWQAEPIWVTVMRAGGNADTLFWPGSEAPIGGLRPRRWLPFDERLRPAELADRMLDWMRDPVEPMAQFSTLYFSTVDKASHDHGPDSPEARAARAEVDAAIGRLVDGLAANHRPIQLIVVSDHGFEVVPPGQQLSTSALLPPDLATPVSEGQVIGFVPRPGQVAAVRQALSKPHPHAACFAREQLPARWHYGRHPRVPPFLCQMDPGWDALFPASWAKARQRPKAPLGSHGFDPELPAMRALFIAWGPTFPAGTTLPVIDNVDVHPLLLKLLRLPPRAGDGNPHRFDGVLNRKPAPEH